jgi:hypothetical protein
MSVVKPSPELTENDGDLSEKTEIDVLGSKDAADIQKRNKLFQEKLRDLCIENDIAEENKKIRQWLMIRLYRISVSWLIFTGIVVVFLAKGCWHLANGVTIFFITSSLATVVGLWAIGLRYFFSTSKNSRLSI